MPAPAIAPTIPLGRYTTAPPFGPAPARGSHGRARPDARALFAFVVGTFRWSLRVAAYAVLLTTDRYPPFSLSA